jgi:pimeloyl-ACP methyl ester carboxylesterase
MTQVFKIATNDTCFVGEQAGKGDTLVFLHAGVADRRMWRPQTEEFSRDFHVVSYDLRGFGESVSKDQPFSHVGDLTDILDYLGLSKVSLVGCSIGGKLAIDFALALPDQVRSLVLFAPAVSGAPPPSTFSPSIEKLLDSFEQAEDAGDLNQVNVIEANMWLDGPTSSIGRVGGGVRELFLNMNEIALNSAALGH